MDKKTFISYVIMISHDIMVLKFKRSNKTLSTKFDSNSPSKLHYKEGT